MPYAMPSPLPQPLSFPLPPPNVFSSSTSVSPPKSPDFVFTSNNSLAPLQGVPRSNKASKIKLQSRSESAQGYIHPATLPRSIPPIPFTTVQPPTPDLTARHSLTPHSASYPLKPKRVRGQRTSPTRTDSNSDSDDNTIPSDAITIGRKRGELLAANRHTFSPPAALPAPSLFPPITSAPSALAPSCPSTKKFHAVVAGQSGVLKLNMDAIKRARSQQEGPSRGIITKPKYNTIGPSTTNLIRKKSGELVKPALRQSTSSFSSTPTLDTEELRRSPFSCTGDLPPMSGARISPDSSGRTLMYRRNSAPSTPSGPKAVKFDSQLEHIKLFLAEQKPAAVSRDGSPQCSTTEDESSGYPWSLRRKNGNGSDADRGKLRLKVTDDAKNGCDTEEARGPYSKALDCPVSSDPEVKLESLVLSDDGKSLRGSVIVKNLAFDKWVAARFTLDWWQTTSEVTARYVDSVSKPPASVYATSDLTTSHDRFVFSIKLDDVLAKIEEKTMFIAIRYCAAGKEMWDNNQSKNYQVLFERVKGSAPTSDSGSLTSEANSNSGVIGSPTKAAGGWPEMADLRKELEKVVSEELSEDNMKRRPLLRKADGINMGKALSFAGHLPVSTGSSPSLSPLPLTKSTTTTAPPTLSQQLSIRYDFATSLNSTWNPSKALDLAVPGHKYQREWNPPPLPGGMPNSQKPAGAKSPMEGKDAHRSSPLPDASGAPGPYNGERFNFPSRPSPSPSPPRSSPTRGSLPRANMKVVFPSAGIISSLDADKPALGSPRDRYGSQADIDAAKSALTRRMSDEDDDTNEKGYSFTFAAAPPLDEGSGSFGRGRRHRRSPSSYFDGWLGLQRLQSSFTHETDVGDDTESAEGLGGKPQQEGNALETKHELALTSSEESEDHEEEDAEEEGNYTLVNVGIDIDEEDEETEREQEKDVLTFLGLRADGGARGRSNIDIDTPSVSISSSSPPTGTGNTPSHRNFYSTAMLGTGGLQPYATDPTSELHSPTSFASTPSVTSSTSTSPTQSYSSLPTSPTSSDMDISTIFGTQGINGNRDSQYNFFIDRYCFFTGGVADIDVTTGDEETASPVHPPRRIHSDSDVDNYFSHSLSGGASYGMYGSPPLSSEGFAGWSSYYHSSTSLGSATGAGYSSGHTTPTRSPKAVNDLEEIQMSEDMEVDHDVSTTPRPGTPADQQNEEYKLSFEAVSITATSTSA